MNKKKVLMVVNYGLTAALVACASLFAWKAFTATNNGGGGGGGGGEDTQYYNFTFSGHNCLASCDDEPEDLSSFILKFDKNEEKTVELTITPQTDCSLPSAKEDVTVVVDNEETDNFTYELNDDMTAVLSVEITGDTNVSIGAEANPDFYKVDATTFKAATDFTNIQYMQSKMLLGNEVIQELEFAPNIYHERCYDSEFITGDPRNCDIYIQYDGSDYYRYQPLTDEDDPYYCYAYSDDAWEIATASDDEFYTPFTRYGLPGLEMSGFVYDSETHYYQGAYGPATISLKFFANKLIELSAPDSPASYLFAYNEDEIKLPTVSAPNYFVSEDVWTSYFETISPYSNKMHFVSSFSMGGMDSSVNYNYYVDSLISGSIVQSGMSANVYGIHDIEGYRCYMDVMDSGWQQMPCADKDEWFNNTGILIVTMIYQQALYVMDFAEFDFDTNEYFFDDGETMFRCQFINNNLVSLNYTDDSGDYIEAKSYYKNVAIHAPEDLPEF